MMFNLKLCFFLSSLLGTETVRLVEFLISGFSFLKFWKHDKIKWDENVLSTVRATKVMQDLFVIFVWLHSSVFACFCCLVLEVCRSRWPRGLRRRSAAALLLGSRVWIPLRAWVFVSCVYVLLPCVGRGLCEGLITLTEESYRVCLIVGDWETSKEEAKAQFGL
jgi:hypothetical protein